MTGARPQSARPQSARSGAVRPLPARRLFGGDPNGLPDRFLALVLGSDGLVPMRAGRLDVVLVADPGLARTLLTLPTGVGKGRGIDALRFLLGEGLLTSGGDLHRRQRRLITPVFAPRRIAGYGTIAVDVARGRAALWRDGAEVDLAREMSSLTLDVVGQALFGADLRGDATEIAAALDRLLPVFPYLMRPLGFAILRTPNPVRHRMRRATARLDVVVDRLITARSATPEGQDVLSALLAARDEETGEPMARRQVRDEAMTLLLAGHETTAVALSWTWLELSRNPGARAWLDAELSTAAAGAAIDAPAWERLPRTRAVIAESMRLHPPAHAVGRRVLSPIDLGGHVLAPGTLCLVSTYALHRDPRSWPDAGTFRPQRWLDEDGRYDELAPGQPRGAYLPFGAGSRICIGAQMAWMETVLVLATLARDFHADVPAGFDPGNQAAVTLRPRRGVPAVLRALTHPSPD